MAPERSIRTRRIVYIIPLARTSYLISNLAELTCATSPARRIWRPTVVPIISASKPLQLRKSGQTKTLTDPIESPIQRIGPSKS
jgi:hypothetical protein